MLVSGGGTADRTIRFRNTLTGATTKVVDAGSQVCCLLFSKLSNELVSTHGYQLNEINLWKLPNMSKVATLTGHSSRVLYLAMSADGSSIVTGAGDETLRFWNLFAGKSECGGKSGGLLQTENLFLRWWLCFLFTVLNTTNYWLYWCWVLCWMSEWVMLWVLLNLVFEINSYKPVEQPA